MARSMIKQLIKIKLGKKKIDFVVILIRYTGTDAGIYDLDMSCDVIEKIN